MNAFLPVYISLSLGSVIIALVYFRYMRKDNRNALTTVLLPLAILPLYVGWVAGAYSLIQGFRQIAESRNGGTDVVAKMLLDANELAFFLTNWVLALSSSFSKSLLGIGILLTVVMLSGSLVQIQRHRALAEEIRYLLLEG